MALAVDQNELLEEIKLELARRRHLDFMQKCWTVPADPMMVGRHTRETAARFDEAVELYRRGISSYTIINWPYRHGKLLADDTPILTADGWKTHGELKIGDRVFSPDGEPVKVIAISPPGMASVDVELSSGETITCHPSHEWAITNRNGAALGVVETRDLCERRLRDRSGKSMCFLPKTKAVQYEEKALPLDPYTLGAWLGDGSTGRPCITLDARDEAVVEGITAAGFEVTARWTHRTTGVITTSFRGLKPNVSGELHNKLEEIGVFRRKHIPEIYLRSSVEQRLALVAGLVDTDGHVEKGSNRTRIVTVIEELRDDIVDLLTTLHFSPSVVRQEPFLTTSGIQGRKPVYYISFQPNLPVPTRLERKRIESVRSHRRIGIRSAKPADRPRMGRCIQVDRTDGLYLAGKTLLPTHNSDMVSRYGIPHLLGEFPDTEVILATHGAKLSQELSRDARSIITSPAYGELYPDIMLDPKSSAVDHWQLYGRRGKLHALGIEGGNSGHGAGILIIDDFYANFEEAESPTIRESRWDGYRDLVTRLAPTHMVFILMTRWHEDDVVGRIKKIMADRKNHPNFPGYEIFNYPAKNETTGEWLFPERMGVQWYEMQWETLGIYARSGRMQGEPSVRGGNMLKTGGIMKVDEMPDDLLWVRLWDLASTEDERTGDDPDYTAGAKVAVKMINDLPWLYIDDVKWCQEEAPARDALILKTALDDGPGVLQACEQVAGYKDAVTTLKKALKGKSIVHGVPANKDKVINASHMEPSFDAGHVVVRRAWWNDHVISELGKFPNGKHDDIPDAISKGFIKAKERLKQKGKMGQDFGRGLVG